MCISLLLYIVSFDGQYARYPSELAVHMHDLEGIIKNIAPSDLSTWTACVFAASKDSISTPLRYRWRLLDRVVDEGEQADWAEVERVLRRYF